MASFHDLLNTLTKDQQPRVWSLVVTIFGVLGQKEGTEFSGAVLNRFMSLTGIKPEATRVAVHRLKKDGWLNARKEGRNSHYSLSASGREQSAAASPRIYHSHTLPEQSWLVVLPRSSELDPQHRETSVAIAPNVWVSNTPVIGPEVLSTLLNANDGLPDWVIDKLIDPSVSAQCDDNLQRLGHVETALMQIAEFTTFQRFVLHVLIIHNWRRIALRLPVLPDDIYLQVRSLIPYREKTLQMIADIDLPTIEDLNTAEQSTPAPKV